MQTCVVTFSVYELCSSSTCASSARACELPLSPRSRLCMALWEKARGRVSWPTLLSPVLLSDTPTRRGPTPFSSTECGSARWEKRRLLTIRIYYSHHNNVYVECQASWWKTTCGLRHAPLSNVFAPWHPTAFRTGLLPVFVAPLPVWVGLEVGLFYLGKLGGTRGWDYSEVKRRKYSK